MSKKISKKQQLAEYDQKIFNMVELVDRGERNASGYGTFGNPKHPNNYKFVGFELKDVKKPKKITDLIALLSLSTIGYNNPTEFKALYDKITETKKTDNAIFFSRTIIVYSVYRTPEGELVKIPQSNHGRGRSFEDVYTITKYFFKTLTWHKFINIVFRSLHVVRNSRGVYIYTQAAYACGSIRKNRVSFQNQLIDNIQNSLFQISADNFEKFNFLFSKFTEEQYKNILSACVTPTVKINTNESLEGVLNQIGNRIFANNISKAVMRYDTKYDSLESMRQLYAKHIDHNDKTVYLIDPVQNIHNHLK